MQAGLVVGQRRDSLHLKGLRRAGRLQPRKRLGRSAGIGHLLRLRGSTGMAAWGGVSVTALLPTSGLPLAGRRRCGLRRSSSRVLAQTQPR
jgi:hypothetical protein